MNRAINFLRLVDFGEFKRGHVVNLFKLDKVQTLRERLGILNDFAAWIENRAPAVERVNRLAGILNADRPNVNHGIIDFLAENFFVDIERLGKKLHAEFRIVIKKFAVEGKIYIQRQVVILDDFAVFGNDASFLRHVIENHENIFARRNNFFAATFQVVEERFLRPDIFAEHLSRQRHLRENYHICAGGACLVNEPQNFFCVHVGMTRRDFHLRIGYFQNQSPPV